MAYHPQGRPPIVSPFYLQWERYPYLRGPNYVRPMFRENSRGGSFRPRPIMRMPLSASEGDTADQFTIPWWCWDKPTFKETHANCWQIEDTATREMCINSIIDKVCPWSSPPSETSAAASAQAPGELAASVTGVFKDKGGNIDPLRVGIGVLVGAVIFSQYKKGSK